MFTGLHTPEGDSVIISTGGTDRVTIDASGNTEFLFPVVAPTLRVTNTGSNNSFVVEDAASTDSTPFVIDASGNVGIGEAVPFAKLVVRGDAYIANGALSAVRDDATSPTTTLMSLGAAGWSPPTVRLAREGASYTATPDNSNVGMIVFTGRDSTDAYAEIGVIRMDAGTNGASGPDGYLNFYTRSSGVVSDRLNINASEFKVYPDLVLEQDAFIKGSIVTMNSAVTGSPSANASFVVERGTSANVEILWNETTDTWQYTNDGSTYTDIGSGTGGGAAKSTIMFLGGM